MGSRRRRDLSINLTSFYMKIAGFWLATNYDEQRWRMISMSYTIWVLVVAIIISMEDFYISWGELSNTIYCTCNIVTVLLTLSKLLILLSRKKDLFHLISYAKKNFWHTNYDPYEQKIVDTCKETCTVLICIFTFFAQGTVMSYLIRPIFANIGQNETERQLPFNMWLGKLPLSVTPYYEMAFLSQVFVLYHIGVCYFCFDNVLCIINLHTAEQFRILQYRFVSMCCINDNDKYSATLEKSSLSKDKYTMFRNLIQQHQALLEYCKQLENVFSIFALAQVTIFSLLICLDGYLVLMWDPFVQSSGFLNYVLETCTNTSRRLISRDTVRARRITFAFHIMGCLCQLLMFTYSCDRLIRESIDVSNAVYDTSWMQLPMDEDGRMLRKDLQFVIMRSKEPCCLTGCGFFVVKLETYTGILSTAVSYFTLLRNQFDVTVTEA